MIYTIKCKDGIMRKFVEYVVCDQCGTQFDLDAITLVDPIQNHTCNRTIDITANLPAKLFNPSLIVSAEVKIDASSHS